jgi:hypothetical protein
MKGMHLDLYFGPHLVGSVSNTYYSELNWYGTLQPSEGMPARIREFITLCQDWHGRLEAGQPHHADEFNAWRDVHDPGEWRTIGPASNVQRITAPVFWPNGDIWWREANDAAPRAAADWPQE